MDSYELLSRLVEQGYTRSQIAVEVGFCEGWVNKWLRRYGLSTNGKSGRKPKQERGSCAVCGKLLKKNAVRFCSPHCTAADKWAKTKSDIEQTGRIANSKQGRRYLFETRGAICAICGSTEWQNQSIPLILDHVNGNSDDWELSNLRLICPNCDALTPTYKNKNRGNGRHARRLRYKQGKSY